MPFANSLSRTFRACFDTSPSHFFGSLDQARHSFVLSSLCPSAAEIDLTREPAVRIAPAKDMCFFDALLAMTLAATIHRSDLAVVKSGITCMQRLLPDARELVVGIVSRPDPMQHLLGFVSKIPDSMLEAPLAA